MIIKLSFIVPLYNVEKYIAECLDSLYAQDIPEEEYEVICVDDCSPDGSKTIVLSYQKQHGNLVLIEHETNKGAGCAENTGLKHAKGRYVWFVDPDDYIKKNSLKMLLNTCIDNNLDVLLFNYQRINNERVFLEECLTFPDTEISSGVSYINAVFGNSFVYHLGYMWRCLFKKDYLLNNNIFFPEHYLWADTVFFPKAILFANRVKSDSDVYYNYRVNNNSISGKNNIMKADRVFQFSFCAGYDLFLFAKEFYSNDKMISSILEKRSHWYFNKFTKMLALSSTVEKKKFYSLVDKNRGNINKTWPYLKKINKILLTPYLGFFVACLLKSLYLLKAQCKW